MDEDSKAIAVGLGAGLGGFAALVKRKRELIRFSAREKNFVSFEVDHRLRLLANFMRNVRIFPDERKPVGTFLFSCLERKSDAKFGKNFQMKTQRRNEKSREKVLAISTIKENSFFPSNDLAGKVKPKATQY